MPLFHAIPLPDATPMVILAIFALTYFGIAIGRVPGLRLNRTGIALLGAIAMLVFARIPTHEAIGLVDWPTILLLFGFFVLAAQLRISGFFNKIADLLAGELERPARFLFLLMAGAAGLSSFLNHDIVCLAFVPVITPALVRRNLNPVPFLVALAIASNIGAAATVIGNPQDMMIAQVAGLDFGRYALWCAVPVALSLASAYGIIWLFSKNRLVTAPGHAPVVQLPEHPFNRRHATKGVVILVVVVLLFLTPLPKELVVLTAAAIHLASHKFRTEDLLGLVDWPVLILFISLFIVTGTLQTTHYPDQAALDLAQSGLDINALPMLAVVTAALSNLINNTAAVMLLVKVVDVAHHPTAAYVLALANSFGGSLLIVGSMSNIIVVQQARVMGVKISLGEFARLGVPVTLAALAWLVLWARVAG